MPPGEAERLMGLATKK